MIVEAAEDLFVPVAVFNNVDGADREVLESFGEPTWNNPVVRIVDAEGQGLCDRIGGDYTQAGLLRGMFAALEAAGREVPPWLRLVRSERAARTARATFAMHCFWQGEARLGGLDGVLRTRTGWLDGHEVVEVDYDPAVIDYEVMVREAQRMECATRVYTRSPDQQQIAARMVGDRAGRTDDEARLTPSDDKHAMRRTPLGRLPMTEAQATRVNAFVARRQDPGPLLSPRQRQLLALIEEFPDADWPLAVGVDADQAWAAARAVAREVRE
jgi:hypothetical protein